MLQLPVYLDNNATTPCDPRVVEAMLPYFSKNFGNAASRSHAYGWQAAEAVDQAREQVASLTGADSSEIIFTSGATEAVNLAIKGVAERYAVKGNHIITTLTEHKAVLDSCKHLETQGVEVSYLAGGADGRIDPANLEAEIRPSTILVAIMVANNETGVLQPVSEISAITRRHGILFFTDASQATGKIPVNVNKPQVDLMAFSAHKMYGPKGIGALYVRRRNPRVSLTAQQDGGGHERNMRSGTLNVPAIAGFGKACALAELELREEATRLQTLRDRLEQSLTQLDEVYINGSTEHRLPHVTNLSFGNLEAGALIAALQMDIAVSSGSACTSASPEPSYVLKAMGVADEQAFSSVRFALGRFTTEEEMEYATGRLLETINKLRTILIDNS